MIKHQLLMMGFRSSIYIAVFVFFVSCVLGYASGLAIETIIQKAVIAGSLSGLAAYILIKVLVGLVPDNIGVESNKGVNNGNESAGK